MSSASVRFFRVLLPRVWYASSKLQAVIGSNASTGVMSIVMLAEISAMTITWVSKKARLLDNAERVACTARYPTPPHPTP